MSVVDVNGTINSFSYTTEKLMKPDDGEKIVTKLSLQLNYVCTVDDASFTTNPQEHSEGVWATREYIAGFEMTEKMKVVVENAFAWYEKVED